MKFLHIRSIQLKIALWASICLIVSGIVIASYSATVARETALRAAKDRAISEARTQAGIVKAEIEVGLDTARARAQELSAVKLPKNRLVINREQVNAMMRQVLVENPQYIGVWTLWEPNAFDGQDARYSNTKTYGKNGRYFPYWNRGTGDITVEPIVDFDTGDWYQEPKKNKQEYVSNLYTYPVMGIDVLMISIVAPIVANGTFYGVTGEDISVTFLQELADKVNIYNGSGKLFLIGSNGKLIASTGRPEMRGRPLRELTNFQISDAYFDVLQTGHEQINLTQDHVEAIVPIHFGRTAKPWAAMVILPSDVIIAPANELLWRLVVLALVMMLVGVVALWLVARHIARPIKQITGSVLQVASGDLTRTIEFSERHDELGKLATGFNYMTQQLRSLYGDLEQRLIELKRSSQSLSESEERFRSLVETSYDWIWEVNEEYFITYASPKLKDLLGYSPDEVMDKYLFDLMPPEEAAHIRMQFSELSQTCQPIENLETTNQHKHGRLVILEISGVPILDQTGLFRGYRGVARNITERKKLEEQLRQSQKMEVIGQLAGGITHDFDNILSIIICFGTLAQNALKDGDPVRVHIEQILSAATRAANLTRSLLTFSRNKPINPQLINLNDIVRKMENFLCRVIGEDIYLETHLYEKSLIVNVDSSQIEQVLMNLAANSRDAMPEGGRLIIKTGVAKIDDVFIKNHGFGVLGNFAVFEVTDFGSGIDNNNKMKIYEPFFSTKEVGKGTGLGLAIVHGIIQQHHGYIHLESEVGKGATFRIYLPIIEAKPLEVEVVPHYPQNGTETILVAEDDAEVRQALLATLNGFGYDVITAENGQDAVDKFEANNSRINLILIDMVMPKKSGIEAYNEIKGLRLDIKALFISGHDKYLTQNKELPEEDVEVIIKPIIPMELARRVRCILDS